MEEVPSGPLIVKGPVGLLLVASWSFKVVFGGVEPVHERLVTCGVPPAAGFASLMVEIRSPEPA